MWTLLVMALAVTNTPVDRVYSIAQGGVVAPDGTLYVGLHNRRSGYSAPPALAAYDADGTLKWQRSFDPWYDIKCKPTIASDGSIVVPLSLKYPDGQHPGKLVAIDPRTQTETWTLAFDAFDEFDQDLQTDGDGTIWIAIGNPVGGDTHRPSLAAVTSTGQLKWRYWLNSKMTPLAPALGAKGVAYVALDNQLDNLHAMPDLLVVRDTSYGAQVTSTSFGRTLQPGAGATVAADGTVYVAAHARYANAGPVLQAYTPEGALKWSVPFGRDHDAKTAPAVAPDGTVYVGLSPRLPSNHVGPSLVAVAPEGSVKWSKAYAAWNELDNGSVSVGSDGTVYVADTSQAGGDRHRPWIAAYDPSGTLRWQQELDFNLTPLWPTPAAAKGTVYVFADNPHESMTWPSRLMTLRDGA